MKTDTSAVIRLTDYTPPPFLIDHVDLRVRLDGANTHALAHYKVRPNPAHDHKNLQAKLELDADGLTAVDVEVDGKSAPAKQDTNSVVFDVPAQQPCDVRVAVTLDPAANKALSGLYLTNSVYCTQCEAQGFRRIVPFLDRPDVLATYQVTLEARQNDCPVLLSNGNPQSTETLSDGWHRTVWHDPHPKPSYLFALVGGQLDKVEDSFTAADGRKVALCIYVEPGKADRADFAMSALKQCMKWDEERFGRVYDLDVFNIVAVSDFNLGAMENKGLNIFNDKYILASPETATDEDYERIDAIIAHEYFHNWSGNRVTCRDWFQLCLKEGLTVFRDQEYTSDLYDRPVKRIRDVRDLWAHQFPEDAGPLSHAVRPDTYREINNFYTATVYEKGAEIVRMISNWLGPVRFRKAMDRYFATFDGQAARLEDFLAAMEAEAQDLGPWPDFLLWYTQAGTPQVSVESKSDTTTGAITFTFKQSTAPTPGQSEKLPLPIPCNLGLVDERGEDLPLGDAKVETTGGRWVDGQFLLEEANGTLHLSGLEKLPACPSLFRDYSSPINLTAHGYMVADRLFLARHDNNAYGSWAQLQSLYSDALQRRYHRLALNEPLGDDDDLFAAMIAKGVSEETAAGHAMRAAAITLPSSQDVARTIAKDIDPERVQRARKTFSQDFCTRYAGEVLGALDALGLADDGIISPSAAAKRSLINALLQHMVHWDDPRAESAIRTAHDAAKGMTMRVKTLSMLIARDGASMQSPLAAFEARFGGDPLSMDKWFTAQAMHGTAADIERLETHPSYDASNPNRARALLGAFAMGNVTGFNAADGSGYRLMAGRIVAIDQNNPQLAARLASAFRSWRTLEPLRRTKAESALKGMIDQTQISVDLGDIAGRILEG
ncbi:MAG: aminopeptidase N [Devosiaceae bacterium]